MKNRIFIIALGFILFSALSICLFLYIKENELNKRVENKAYTIISAIQNNIPLSRSIISKEDYLFIKEDLHSKHLNKIEIVEHHKISDSERVVIYLIDLISFDANNNIVFARGDNVMIYLHKNENMDWDINEVKYSKGNS